MADLQSTILISEIIQSEVQSDFSIGAAHELSSQFEIVETQNRQSNPSSNSKVRRYEIDTISQFPDQALSNHDSMSERSMPALRQMNKQVRQKIILGFSEHHGNWLELTWQDHLHRVVFKLGTYRINQKQITRKQSKVYDSVLKISQYEGSLTDKETDYYLTFYDVEGFQPEQYKQSYRSINHIIKIKFEHYRKQQIQMYTNKNIFVNQHNLINDDRVHLCLYFINQQAYQVDCLYLKKLTKLVNVISVLPKGDQYTINEIIRIKQTIQSYSVKLDLYDCAKPLDQFTLKQLNNGKYGACPPFMINNTAISQSDFKLLYTLIINQYTQNLIQLTDFYLQKYLMRGVKKQKERKHGFLQFVNQILKRL